MPYLRGPARRVRRAVGTAWARVKSISADGRDLGLADHKAALADHRALLVTHAAAQGHTLERACHARRGYTCYYGSAIWQALSTLAPRVAPPPPTTAHAALSQHTSHTKRARCLRPLACITLRHRSAATDRLRARTMATRYTDAVAPALRLTRRPSIVHP